MSNKTTPRFGGDAIIHVTFEKPIRFIYDAPEDVTSHRIIAIDGQFVEDVEDEGEYTFDVIRVYPHTDDLKQLQEFGVVDVNYRANYGLLVEEVDTTAVLLNVRRANVLSMSVGTIARSPAHREVLDEMNEKDMREQEEREHAKRNRREKEARKSS
jgi:hypothetical protein